MELRDRAGEPIHLTPHDFRRIFSTTAVQDGLPLHIASKILGHRHLTSTEPYVAVFQDDLITPTAPSSTTGAPAVPPRSTANPPTPNGKSSKNTSPCAGSNWAAAPAPTAPAANTNTPACAAPYSESTPPNSTGWPRSSPTSKNASSKPRAWLAREVAQLTVTVKAARDKLARHTPTGPSTAHGLTLLPHPTTRALQDAKGVTLGTRRCSVGKESFGVEGARAPGAGGGDGLTVGVVDQVPAGKDPVHGGAGRAALRAPPEVISSCGDDKANAR